MTVSILRSKNSSGGRRPGILWIHGGGMVMGTKDMHISQTFEWVKELDLVLVSPEYRLAPEHPDPAPVNDCYTALEWMTVNSSELIIDPEKVIVAGGSAGGGLAAGVALMARDRKGPKLYAQLLLCPMLDDRVISKSSKQFWDVGSWTGKVSADAWNLLLSGKRGTDGVSIYAAPGRASDLAGLPQAYIDVAECEPFRDDCVAYASKLWECGVSAELHVLPGAWHGFDLFAPGQLTKFSQDLKFSWLRRIFTVAASPSV